MLVSLLVASMQILTVTHNSKNMLTSFRFGGFIFLYFYSFSCEVVIDDAIELMIFWCNFSGSVIV